MAKIIKVLNHNALIVHDAQSSRALLLLGKGIGFGRRINEQLEIDKAEGCSVYELQQKTSKGETRDVLRSMDPLYLEISAEIVELAEREFGEIDRNILVPLADHIAFALTRIRSKMNITNPFSNDIRLLYPREYEVAQKGRQIILARVHEDINEDEVGYITLHIHSAMGEKVDEGMLAAVIVNESIQQIEQECGLSIDVNSLSYSRLLTHMKYLMARLRENETLTLDMEEYTKNAFPYSYQVAAHIIERLSRTLNREVPQIETGYLAMHIERVCQNERQA